MQQKNPPQEEQAANQLKRSRTQIERANVCCLKPGDHISWHMSYIVWHHAIVSDIDIRQRRIRVFHWNVVEGHKEKVEVVEEWLSLDKPFRDLFRIDYPAEVLEKNPSKLVLARAESRLGETHYGLLKNNCEALAAFCKTGVIERSQVQWLWEKRNETTGTVASQLTQPVPKTVCISMKETITSGARKTLGEAAKITLQEAAESTGKVALAEIIETVIHASNWVGGGIVIAVEAALCTWDVSKMDENRNTGKITRNNFIVSVSQRLSKAVMGAGLAIGGSLLGAALGSVVPVISTAIGAAVGVFIGSIVGGVIGLLAGKVIGSLIGLYVGNAIVHFINRNV